jgi:hypothetical protein
MKPGVQDLTVAGFAMFYTAYSLDFEKVDPKL